MEEVIIGIFKAYNKERLTLSKARLVYTVYLIDWRYTLIYGRPFTNIEWYNQAYVDNYAILNFLGKNDKFEVISRCNAYNKSNHSIRMIENHSKYTVDSKLYKVICYVLNIVKDADIDEIWSCVFSTYAMRYTPSHYIVNLEQLAIEYHKDYSDN